MKEVFAGIGVVLLLICGWLALLTYRSGGIRRVGSDGSVEILGAHGWQTPGPGEETDAALPFSIEQDPAVIRPSAIIAPTQPVELPFPTVPPSPIRVVAAPAPRSWPSEPVASSAWPEEQSLSADNPDAPPVSPWTVLGWALVGILPPPLIILIVLSARRYLASNQGCSPHSRPSRTAPPLADTGNDRSDTNQVATFPSAHSWVPVESYLTSIGRVDLQSTRPAQPGSG